jgi:glycosyltransferase involved in cell wall biosynthesis
MLKVSVIIPTYNRADLLERAIRSVLSQTYRDFEIIVVDDASIDNTQEMVKEKFKQEMDSGILRYVRNETNMERSHSRNKGMEIAQGEYIAFLDDDDIWLPHRLAISVRYITERKRIACVFAKPLWLSEDGTLEDKFERLFQKNLNNDSSDFYRDLCIAGNMVFSQISLFKKEIYRDIGGFRDGIAPNEDWEFFSRVAMNYNIGYVNTITCLIYVHKGSHSKKTVGDNAYIKENALRIIEQNSINYGYPIKGSLAGEIYFIMAENFIPNMKKVREYLLRAIKADYSLLFRLDLWEIIFRMILGKRIYLTLKNLKKRL